MVSGPGPCGGTCRSSEALGRDVTHGSGCVETDWGGHRIGEKAGTPNQPSTGQWWLDGLLAERGQCRWHHRQTGAKSSLNLRSLWPEHLEDGVLLVCFL